MDRQAISAKIDALSTRNKIILLVLVLVSMGGSYWYFFYQPTQEELAAVQGAISGLQQEIGTYQNQVMDLPKQREEVEIKSRQLTQVMVLRPQSNEEQEKLLANIEALAKDEGITFKLYKPGGEQVTELYAAVDIDLDLEGNFHNLMRFFSRMANLDRLVTLQQLALQPVKAESGGVVPLNARSKIKLYRAMTEQELAERNAKAKEKQKGKK